MLARQPHGRRRNGPRNSLIDEGARFAADANREACLEHARLGLAEDADLRPTSESDFVSQSLRERQRGDAG